MLTLRRKQDEKVIISLPDKRTVEIEVLSIKSRLVSLGFTGPEDIIIDREEIHLRRNVDA